MSAAVKFTISLPPGEFKDIEARRRKAGKTRSQYIREAVRVAERAVAGRPGEAARPALGVKEGQARYGLADPALPELIGVSERRRRAIVAAGRFRSGRADLSTAHDDHIADARPGTEECGPAAPADVTDKP